MQVTLRWNNENMVRLDDEFLRDQGDRHCRIPGKYIVKLGSEVSDVIDDHKSDAHVARKVLEKLDIRVESAC